MEDVLGSLLYSFIGRIYLWIRYRNKEKVRAVLKEKYNDSYYDAGATKVLYFVGIVLGIIIIVFICRVIFV